MPLEFVGDAISLSGLAGTRLKCDVIGRYYPFWWGITSGGARNDYRYHTAIVELNAATGEVYIKDTGETVLGSAGHALELKSKNPNAKRLTVVLVEEDADCYAHLKKVIKRRWTSIPIDEAEGPIDENTSDIYLLNMDLNDALDQIKEIKLGNTLYFFDPLRSVDFATVKKVAQQRIPTFYRTGTEFMVFVFTSDWLLGRADFSPLPCTASEEEWTEEEKKTVLEAESLFGSKEWYEDILNGSPVSEREEILLRLYKRRLREWFRYVRPLPFNPKNKQIFHLILCSNYEAGVKATKDFYANLTGNPTYSPDNGAAFARFRALHPEVFLGISGNRRPLEWRYLWKVITGHEGGVCDGRCKDLREVEPDLGKRRELLKWLRENGYLKAIDITDAWNSNIPKYKVNWKTVKEKLGVGSPIKLKPVSPKDLLKMSGVDSSAD